MISKKSLSLMFLTSLILSVSQNLYAEDVIHYPEDREGLAILPNGDFISRKVPTDYPKGRGPYFILYDTPYYFNMREAEIENEKEIAKGEEKKIRLKGLNFRFELADLNHLESSISIPEDEANKLIQERVIPFLPKDIDIKFEYYKDWGEQKVIGEYKNGVYTSRLASLKRDIAIFKKKYGFDPIKSSWKETVKPGRTMAAFKACNKLLRDHGYSWMAYSLSIDHGSSKCYEMSLSDAGQDCGYFWIKNGRIISVSWY